jgi:hypothetical protein
MTTEGILDTLRRRAETEQAWDEAAASIGATLAALDQTGVRRLVDGLSRIAREQKAESIRGSSRLLLAVLRGASHALAEAVTEQLTDEDLMLVKDSAVFLASLIESSNGIARAKDLVSRAGWKPSRVSTTLDELIEGGFVADLPYKGRPAEDKKARLCRLLPLGRRLVRLRGSLPVAELVVAPPDAVRALDKRSSFTVSNLPALRPHASVVRSLNEV